MYQKGHKPYSGCFKKGIIPWNKGLHPEYMQGKNNPAWKGGHWSNKEFCAMRLKKRRHILGVSKKYRGEYAKTPEETKLRKRLHGKIYKALKKGGGKLSIKTIQMVYEDNIKRYGTLTCYLCELPVPFKKDHLEHKMPLSRGGTNEYSNLAIACQRCNNKKFNKTEAEYKQEVKII